MKNVKVIAFVLVVMMVLFSMTLGVEDTQAASWTKSKVTSEIKKTNKQISRYTKLYNSDKGRVNKVNKGKIELPSGSPNALISGDSILIKDSKAGVYYDVTAGKSFLNIADYKDGTGYVSGYVKKVGTVYKNIVGWKIQKVKGVKYTKNRYADKLKKLKSKKSALKASLKAKYSVSDLPECVSGAEYNLSKYLEGDDAYNDDIWTATDNDTATLSTSGKLIFKQPGTIDVTVKASVSGKKTTFQIKCVDVTSANIENISGASSITEENGNYRIVSEYGAKFRLICKSDYLGQFTYASSNPAMFTVDSTGTVTILGTGFGYEAVSGTVYSNDCYITASIGDSVLTFYLSVPVASFTVDAVYTPGTGNNDFSFQKIYDDNTYLASKLYNGDKIQLVMDPAPSEAINYEISVIRNFDNKMTVDSNGLITMPVWGIYYDVAWDTGYSVQVKLGNNEKTIYLDFYGDPDKK